jgi:hypothetical protein
MIDFSADLDIFLADFGEAITYTPQGGQVKTITGIFDLSYAAATLGLGSAESSDPAATCKSSDLSGARHGDTMAIRGVTYAIKAIEPDGTGFTIVRLKKA